MLVNLDPTEVDKAIEFVLANNPHKKTSTYEQELDRVKQLIKTVQIEQCAYAASGGYLVTADDLDTVSIYVTPSYHSTSYWQVTV